MSKGFTLPELLIGISIMILIGLVALPNIKTIIDKGHDATRKGHVRSIVRAFEDYYNDKNCYPVLTILSPCGGPQLSPPLFSMPCDPQTRLPYKYIARDEANLCKGYRLFTSLRNLKDPDIVSVGCSPINGCGYGVQWNWGMAAGGPLTAPGFIADVPPDPPPPYPPGGYACDPSGICNSYANPAGSGCPITFNQSDCYNTCTNPANRCLQ